MKYFPSVICVFLLALIGSMELTAQNNVNVYSASGKTFHELRKEFLQSSSHISTQSKAFRRWEHFWKNRVDEQGNFPNGLHVWNEVQRMKNKHHTHSILTSQWKEMGPIGQPSTKKYNYNGGSGIGRVNCITFHPSDSNLIWIGSAGGGAWKTTDGGHHWQHMTPNIPTLGIGDIAIHPTNPDIVYIGTGDGFGSFTSNGGYSVGILRSMDGGQTWAQAGLSFNLYHQISRYRLVIHPNRPEYLLVATNQGLLRSMDGGKTWVIRLQEDIGDIEFHPTIDSIAYASSYTGGFDVFFKSTDYGNTWKPVPFSPSIQTYGRVAIAVSQANPAYVYAVSVNQYHGFDALLRSTDNGETWEERSKTPNILGYTTNGQDNGGQSWRNLCIAVSPADPNELYVGGINVWQSLDGGVSWSIKGFWAPNSESVPYIHADQLDLEYNNNGVLHSGNDGGIYRITDDSTWQDIHTNLGILQIYRIGTSATDHKLVLTGSQDNGTNIYDNDEWGKSFGADGTECLVDFKNPNIVYYSYQGGKFVRSKDRGKNKVTITPPNSGSGSWITPFIMNPHNPQSLFVGYRDIYKSTDRGDNWIKISPWAASGRTLETLTIAPSDTHTIYATAKNRIARTTNSGESWTRWYTSLPNITSLIVHPTNPLRLWVTCSSFALYQQCFTSDDGGKTWTQFSQGLLRVPAHTIVYQNNSPERLFIGTEIGVFYRDSTNAEWQQFGEGLPSVIVNELEIHYKTGHLRAGTFGRGLWEAPLPSDITSVQHSPQDGSMEQQSAASMSVQPNPSDGTFTILLKNIIQGYHNFTITVSDIQGKEILRTQHNATGAFVEIPISIPSALSGQYFVRVKGTDATLTRTITITK